jgi:hypothetical protein
MAMFEKANLQNEKANNFVNDLRMKHCGYAKVYTAKYMRELARVCQYQLTNSNHSFIYHGTQHDYKSPRECGQMMEKKIDSLFMLGILK